jgi:hypothetical protein
VSIPAGPGDVSETWLRGVLLREGQSTEERRLVRVDRIGVGYGLDGVVARVTTAEPDGREATLVAKWCRAEAGAREARFYREVAPHLGIDVPRLHSAFVESDRALLLLEEIAPSRQGDAIVGATLPEAKGVVDVAVCIHAQFWGRSNDPLVAGLPRWGGDPSELAEKTRARLAEFLERWRSELTPGVRTIAERLPDTLPTAYAALAAAPATVIHGDFHLDNVLFRPDGSAVVIDWTHAAVGPAAIDVTRLLTEGLTVASRRAFERDLVDRYLRGLSGRGIRHGASAFEADRDHALTVHFAGAVRSKEPAPDSPARLVPIVENLARNVMAAVEDRLAVGGMR